MFTLDDVLPVLKQVADERPNHVDEGANIDPGRSSCLYVYNSGNRCIAGEVLHRLGIEDDVMDGWEGYINDVNDDSEWDEEIDELVEDVALMTPEAADLLTAAQHKQDGGMPWGQVVKEVLDDYLGP